MKFFNKLYMYFVQYYLLNFKSCLIINYSPSGSNAIALAKSDDVESVVSDSVDY